MKNLHFFVILLFLTILFEGCGKDDDYTPPPRPYFYCKINGQNFAARGLWQCQPRIFNYYPNGFMSIDPGSMIIGATDCRTFNSVGIRIYKFVPTLDTIDFSQPIYADSISPFFFFDNEDISQLSILDSLISGRLLFTAFSDKQKDKNGIVAGTFEFTVRNEELDTTVFITDGRFQYIIDYEWY